MFLTTNRCPLLNFFSPSRTEKVTWPHSVLRKTLHPRWSACFGGEAGHGVARRRSRSGEHAVVLTSPPLTHGIRTPRPMSGSSSAPARHPIRYFALLGVWLDADLPEVPPCRSAPASPRIPAELPGTPRAHPPPRTGNPFLLFHAGIPGSFFSPMLSKRHATVQNSIFPGWLLTEQGGGKRHGSGRGRRHCKQHDYLVRRRPSVSGTSMRKALILR